MRPVRITAVVETSRILAQTSCGEPQLTKFSSEGGMLVNKISREGPYLVKTDISLSAEGEVTVLGDLLLAQSLINWRAQHGSGVAERNPPEASYRLSHHESYSCQGCRCPDIRQGPLLAPSD
jgi:hypothetical protein